MFRAGILGTIGLALLVLVAEPVGASVLRSARPLLAGDWLRSVVEPLRIDRAGSPGQPLGVHGSGDGGSSFTAVAEASEKARSPGVGDMAPDVTLGDQHGKPFALGDALKTREFVVIAFYPKAFTGG
jgi:hypothetical protein